MFRNEIKNSDWKQRFYLFVNQKKDYLYWRNEESYCIFEGKPAYENCLGNTEEVCLHILHSAYFFVLRIELLEFSNSIEEIYL